MTQMTPREIVSELDKHIVGQEKAKRAVAIALRNRWRRTQVAEPLRSEITPKNILMIGPTGVGKTEIARRLARLSNAPFIKVEATKFTEVGYVGRDVETIIRDLMEISLKAVRERAMLRVRDRALDAAEDAVLNILLPQGRDSEERGEDSPTRQKFRKKLREGDLDDKEIEIDTTVPVASAEIFGPPGMEEMTQQIQGLFQNISSGKKRTRKMKIVDALKVLADEEASGLIDEDDVKIEALRAVEQNGIVFLDEIDKVAVRSESSGADVSRQGVQRDLLPLVEGTTVSTRYGMVKTDHILFIASGAFHLSRPSDLIPELQGRFPIRVELENLSVEDFERILTQTDACLVQQYQALLETDSAKLDFSAEGIRRIAEVAFQVNEKTENIGARRLYTIMEKLLEKIAFEAGDHNDAHLHIDAAYVETHLQALAEREDLARYIL